MRGPLLVVALSVFIALLCGGQVSAQNSSEQFMARTVALQFFDETHGIATTGGDVILTDDGGRSWRQVILDPPPQVESMATEPSGHVWVLAGDDRLLHSPDRGASWEEVALADELQSWLHGGYAGHPRGLLQIAVSGAGSIWVAGGNCFHGQCGRSTLFRSDDSGATWKLLDYGGDIATLTGQVWFSREGRDVWASALGGKPYSGNYTPVLLHSSDGGDSWEWIRLGAEFNLLYFSSGSRGFALWRTGDPMANSQGLYIVTTADSGQTWQVAMVLPSSAWVSDDSTEWYWPAVDLAPPQEAWVAFLDCLATPCSPETGAGFVVLHTGDGGLTWDTRRLPYFVWSMDFVNPQHGVLSTSSGMLVTDDGLNTWEPADMETTAPTVVRIVQRAPAEASPLPTVGPAPTVEALPSTGEGPSGYGPTAVLTVLLGTLLWVGALVGVSLGRGHRKT